MAGITRVRLLAAGIVVAILLVFGVGFVLYWFAPAKERSIRSGESVDIRSGLSFRVPPGGSGRLTEQRRSNPGVDSGIASQLVLRHVQAAGGRDVHVFTFWQPDRVSVVRGVLHSFLRLTSSANHAVDARWRDWGDGHASVAVVTRLEGSQQGLLIVNGVPGIGNRREAWRELRDIWRELSIRGAELPSMSRGE
jgi:hypothetical protein